MRNSIILTLVFAVICNSALSILNEFFDPKKMFTDTKSIEHAFSKLNSGKTPDINTLKTFVIPKGSVPI